MLSDTSRSIVRALEHRNRRAADEPAGVVPPRVPAFDPALYNAESRTLLGDWLYEAASPAGQLKIVTARVAARARQLEVA